MNRHIKLKPTPNTQLKPKLKKNEKTQILHQSALKRYENKVLINSTKEMVLHYY